LVPSAVVLQPPQESSVFADEHPAGRVKYALLGKANCLQGKIPAWLYELLILCGIRTVSPHHCYEL
jgi:hypothetical protein